MKNVMLIVIAAVLMLGTVAQAALYEQDFSSSDALDDWGMYEDYSYPYWTQIPETENCFAWAWGSNTKNAAIYEPTTPLVLPDTGYVEAKIRWDHSMITTVCGVMARATGQVTGGSRDYIQSLRLLFRPATKGVILYEDSVFTNWGDTTSGTDGTFDAYTGGTQYTFRLSFSGASFWGEILDASGTSVLYTTATKTASTLLSGGGGGMMAAFYDSGYDNGKPYFDDFTIVPEPATLLLLGLSSLMLRRRKA